MNPYGALTTAYLYLMAILGWHGDSATRLEGRVVRLDTIGDSHVAVRVKERPWTFVETSEFLAAQQSETVSKVVLCPAQEVACAGRGLVSAAFMAGELALCHVVCGSCRMHEGLWREVAGVVTDPWAAIAWCAAERFRGANHSDDLVVWSSRRVGQRADRVAVGRDLMGVQATLQAAGFAVAGGAVGVTVRVGGHGALGRGHCARSTFSFSFEFSRH